MLVGTNQIGVCSTPRNCPIVTHLAFADDVLIFTNGSAVSLAHLMHFLSQYEEVSRHLINRQKSCFIIGDNSPLSRAQSIDAAIGFVQKSLPIQYLGCNLFNGRKIIHYLDDLIAKIKKNVSGWKSRFLSYRGRLELIRHVLQSLSIHLLAAFCPPKAVFRRIDALFPIFFRVRENMDLNVIGLYGSTVVSWFMKVGLAQKNGRYKYCFCH